MSAITYRLSAEKLRGIKLNAATQDKSVPAYLEPFMDLAANRELDSDKVLKDLAKCGKSKPGTQLRKGGKV